MSQPIIRGIQAVGAVDIYYRYNGGTLNLPGVMKIAGNTSAINTSEGIALAGFRLDGEFLRAVQQIASSFTIPILGGGGVSLTNNNRTGTLTINCTKVSTPSAGVEAKDTWVDEDGVKHEAQIGTPAGSMHVGDNLGPVYNTEVVTEVKDPTTNKVTSATYKYTDPVYDLTFIAQAQQAQEGGDSVGSTICVTYKFCGLVTMIQFEGCTIATVDPVGLSGNDAVSYQVVINYLNWRANYSGTNVTGHFITG